VLYTADLVRLIDQHGLHGHLFADDTQVIGSCQPRDINALQSRMSICLDDVPPGCDQIGCSSTSARRSCFGVPLHVVKVGWCFVGWTTATRRCPACLTTSSVVCSRHQCGDKIDLQSPVFGLHNVSLDGTALVECSRSSRLQGCDVLPLSP